MRYPRRSRTVGGCTNQHGAILSVVLILLTTVSLMALTGFYISSNQYRMVGNIQYQEQAFNQAEAVVAEGEEWVKTDDNAKSSDFETYSVKGGGLYPIGQLAVLNRDVKTMTWSNANSIAQANGRYLIAQIAKDVSMGGNSLQKGQAASACRKVNVFQVVGRSDPVRGASRTIETTYVTPGC